jgi:4-hydroxy-2-oxoglutarate aldolase
MLRTRALLQPLLLGNRHYSSNSSSSSSGAGASPCSGSAREILCGVFAPIPTPFRDDDLQQIDFDQLDRNIHRWLGATTTTTTTTTNTPAVIDSDRQMMDGICVMGSNGEFPLLRDDEKAALLERVATTTRRISRDIRLIAGTGSVSTQATIDLTKHAQQLGYDAAMVVTPYYYTSRMTQERLAQHFIAIANAVDIPIVLYSMPSFAGGVTIDKELVVQLAQHPNIIGMKDSSGNVDNLRDLVQATAQQDFALLAGTGSVFYQCLMHGASGGIVCASTCIVERERQRERERVADCLLTI